MGELPTPRAARILAEMGIDVPERQRVIADDVLLIAGDHLRVSRGLYTHHGVMVGHLDLRKWRRDVGRVVQRGRLGSYPVVHYADGGGKGRIALTSLESFLAGATEFDIVFHEDTGHLSSTEIVHRALAHVGLADYHLVQHNCEHFSTWCVTGHWSSSQVTSAGAAFTAATFMFGGWQWALTPLLVTLGSSSRRAPVEPCTWCDEPHGWELKAAGEPVFKDNVRMRMETHENREADLARHSRRRDQRYYQGLLDEALHARGMVGRAGSACIHSDNMDPSG